MRAGKLHQRLPSRRHGSRGLHRCIPECVRKGEPRVCGSEVGGELVGPRRVGAARDLHLGHSQASTDQRGWHVGPEGQGSSSEGRSGARTLCTEGHDGARVGRLDKQRLSRAGNWRAGPGSGSPCKNRAGAGARDPLHTALDLVPRAHVGVELQAVGCHRCGATVAVLLWRDGVRVAAVACSNMERAAGAHRCVIHNLSADPSTQVPRAALLLAVQLAALCAASRDQDGEGLGHGHNG
mmetsp:Transcript_7592/g.13418  ORF Transcript_7592/g.13418 Transcript_7592/m.13418 type:complete len:238 (-) Transcript_7592:828-1541(-)